MTDEQTKDQKPKPVPIGAGSMAIALASIRNTEAHLRWQGAQWVIALNLSSIVAVLYRFISKPDTPELFVLAVGCVVIATLDYEWYNVLRRDGRLLGLWSSKFIEHEAENGTEGGVKVFTSSEYASLSNSRDRLQRRLERITVGFIIIWAAAAIAIFTWALGLTIRG